MERVIFKVSLLLLFAASTTPRVSNAFDDGSVLNYFDRVRLGTQLSPPECFREITATKTEPNPSPSTYPTQILEVNGPKKVPVSVLTPEQYKQVMQSLSADGAYAWKYAIDGCAHRSYLVGHELEKKGIETVQILFMPTNGGIIRQQEIARGMVVARTWSFHIASAVYVKDRPDSPPVLKMLDPTLNSYTGEPDYSPVTKDEWVKKLTQMCESTTPNAAILPFSKYALASRSLSAWHPAILEECRKVLREEKAALRVLNEENMKSVEELIKK